MPESAAYLETASGQKYLVQLCKHFAHKIAVTYTESRGDCRFPRGAAVLQADENGLSMVVTAADEEGLAQTQEIIESHLVRFAFREKLEALDWRQDRAA
ncbi:DUF2218 domain-containing protein (plasmid) [Shinella sp. PSBB067]|uniref:DUF2218 domain-containing protein n=1 Tax=unclassified Shinella TaxID=2643062 RepID=UPI0009282459|nr:DUF2218 domain-containing protein [Shinella sp. PSBB067]OJU99587.1 MAG: 2,4-dihydroxyhept-2-ene-1,7-dioic acid aldolase [Shinella sp. 65-6]QRI66545.1 DUF2218 domain-containing protein [Shinella sp. PSBB067]